MRASTPDFDGAAFDARRRGIVARAVAHSTAACMCLEITYITHSMLGGGHVDEHAHRVCVYASSPQSMRNIW